MPALVEQPASQPLDHAPNPEPPDLITSDDPNTLSYLEDVAQNRAGPMEDANLPMHLRYSLEPYLSEAVKNDRELRHMVKGMKIVEKAVPLVPSDQNLARMDENRQF